MKIFYLLLISFFIEVVFGDLNVLNPSNMTEHYYTTSDGYVVRSIVEVVLSNDDYNHLSSSCDHENDDYHVYYLHKDKDARPGVRVTTCSKKNMHGDNNNNNEYTKNYALKSTARSNPYIKRGMKVAACVPTIFNSKDNKNNKNRKKKKYENLNPNNRNHNNYNDHMWKWLQGWMELNHQMGIEHFFIYTANVLPSDNSDSSNSNSSNSSSSNSSSSSGLNTKVPHTFINIPWIRNIRKKKDGPLLWYYGQYWTINDCLYRNKALGTEWLMLTDLDEVYSSDVLPTFTTLIDDRIKKQPLLDSIFLGNYKANTSTCNEIADQKTTSSSSSSSSSSSNSSDNDEWRRSWSLPPSLPPSSASQKCEIKRDALPECRLSRKNMHGKNKEEYLKYHSDALFMCKTWRGRRKHIDRVSSVALTKVHKTLKCTSSVVDIKEARQITGITSSSSRSSSSSGGSDGEVKERSCIDVHVDARMAWLDHFQGAPYKNAGTQCRCQ